MSESESEGTKTKLYPKDMKQFLLWGATGFAVAGLYQMGCRLTRRNVKPESELEQETDGIIHDHVMLDAFIYLQEYKTVNNWSYQLALQNSDSLLFLEHVLVTEQVSPTRFDKPWAFALFQIAVKRLKIFQSTVKESMGTAHAFAVHLCIRKIYKGLQRSMRSILHKCSEFNPDQMMKRVKVDLAQSI
jgi:hypothetical protein